MELKQLSENVFYIPNVTNIGVIQDGAGAILIDTGLDDDTARKVLQVLAGNKLHPKAIINTHSHADHCGGNAFIQARTGAVIYAAGIEASLIQSPYLEPFYLFSGANPVKALKNKFLMAKPSSVGHIISEQDTALSFDTITLRLVRLPGHSPDQIGIEAEGIFFCGDSIFSKEVLERHRIPFGIHIEEQKKTLDFLAASSYSCYVPSHSEAVAQISGLAADNKRVIEGVERVLLETVDRAKTTEEIMKDLFDGLKLEIKGMQQYYLMHAVVMAYLGTLHDRNQLKTTILKNALYWERM